MARLTRKKLLGVRRDLFWVTAEITRTLPASFCDLQEFVLMNLLQTYCCGQYDSTVDWQDEDKVGFGKSERERKSKSTF